MHTTIKFLQFRILHQFTRVNKLDIKVDDSIDNSENEIILAIDSTGIKVANRGEWIRQKWHMRRGFLKIHVGADVKTKKIVSFKITDDHFHDSKHLPELVEQALYKGNVIKVLADGHMIQRAIFHTCIITQMHYLQSR